ncbi:MAG: FIST C-terminal domain-containing protein [Anaerolineales bacterium]|nr:FIST C-terminal domain-containing protein [Anaerolineales bacterium]
MSKIGVSSTSLADPRAAAGQLVTEARAGLTAQPALAVLFATADYDTQALVAGVSAALEGVPVWGGSSASGVFANDRWVTGEKGAAALMLIADRKAGAALQPVGADAVQAGAAAAEAALRQAGGQASALLTLAYMGPEEALLQGVAQAAPKVPVVGGSASDGAGRFQQFGRGQVLTEAVTLAALGGPVGYAFAHGYRPTGKTARVTRAQGRRILELDGRPALAVYGGWTGAAEAEINGGAILTYSVFHPLLRHLNGDTLAIHPVAANPDGSIDTGAAMAEGLTLELGLGTLDELIAAVAPVVRQAAQTVKKPAAVLLSHCGGRAIGLGGRIAEVAGQVRQAVGAVPWIGYLAFGEQGCLGPGRNAHANLSLSALVLGEV